MIFFSIAMMKDAKLTPQQAKQLSLKIKNKEPLPKRIDPTSSKPGITLESLTHVGSFKYF